MACATCSTCSTTPRTEGSGSALLLICARCLPRHVGHDITPLDALALEARGRVALLLCGAPLSATSDAAGAQEPIDAQSVVAIRAAARRIAEDLASVPGHAEAAHARVAEARDAIIAAVSLRAAQLDDEISSAALAKEAAIRAELTNADAELERVTETASLCLRAIGGDGLCDVDAVVHEAAIAVVVRASVASASACAARPPISPVFEVRPRVAAATGAPDVAAALRRHAEAAAAALGVLHMG